jgi:hypothetical protein
MKRYISSFKAMQIKILRPVLAAQQLMPVNPSYLGGRDRRTEVPGQPGQNTLAKLGVVAHTCNSTYLEG